MDPRHGDDPKLPFWQREHRPCQPLPLWMAAIPLFEINELDATALEYNRQKWRVRTFFVSCHVRGCPSRGRGSRVRTRQARREGPVRSEGPTRTRETRGTWGTYDICCSPMPVRRVSAADRRSLRSPAGAGERPRVELDDRVLTPLLHAGRSGPDLPKTINSLPHRLPPRRLPRQNRSAHCARHRGGPAPHRRSHGKTNSPVGSLSGMSQCRSAGCGIPLRS